jgi:hypothetical protein
MLTMPDQTVPEPPAGTMLLGLDPTPGYEGVVVGVWHRRDDSPWADGEHRWLCSSCCRHPVKPYTWAEALARGAQPERLLVEIAAGVAAGRAQAAADLAAIFEKRAEDERRQPGNWALVNDWDVAAQVCEDYAEESP